MRSSRLRDVPTNVTCDTPTSQVRLIYCLLSSRLQANPRSRDRAINQQRPGQEKVLTTFSSYGELAAERQREIIRDLAQPMDPDPQLQEILKQLMRTAKSQARAR
jgi:hypothetical protein